MLIFDLSKRMQDASGHDKIDVTQFDDAYEDAGALTQGWIG